MPSAVLSLSPHVSLLHSGTEVTFLNERRALRVDCGVFCSSLVQRMEESRALAHWLRDVDLSFASHMISELRQAGFLTLAAPGAQLPDIYSRNLGWLAQYASDPVAAHRYLNAARIAILGVGGIGGECLRHLAAMGVMHFYLLDCDTVEPANLNRQYLYTSQDFGQPKTQAAAAAILRDYRTAAIVTSNGFISEAADLRVLDAWKPDLILCAADKPIDRINAIVASYAAEARVAWIAGGAGLERGHWGPVQSPMHTEPAPAIRAAPARSLPWHQRLPHIASEYSFGPSNSIVAAWLARDILVWLIRQSPFAACDPGEPGVAPGTTVIDLAGMTIARQASAAPAQ